MLQKHVIRNKLGLLGLTSYLKNVSGTCKVMGYYKDTFYRVKQAYEKSGEDALMEANRRKPNIKNRVDKSTEKAVIQFALENPAFGQKRTSDELRSRGIFISAGGVHFVCLETI